MKHSVRNQYLILSGLLFTFFFTRSSAFSLFSIWLNQYVGLKGAETGATFSAIAITALSAQPLYGVIQDMLGLKKHLLWAIGILLLISGPFLIYVYAPLLRLRTNMLAGADICFRAGPRCHDYFTDETLTCGRITHTADRNI